MKRKHILLFFLVFSLAGFTFSNIPFVSAPPSITFGGGIITVQGALGAGDTWGTAIAFWDLWQASDANGWNVVRMFQSDNVTYEFGCRIRIGGISTHTYFWDRNVQVAFNTSAVSGNAQHLIEIKYRGHLRLGQLDDAVNKLTSQGCQMFVADNPYLYTNLIYGQHVSADIQLYSSSFKTDASGGGKAPRLRYLRNNAPVYNCELDGYIFEQGDIDGYRITTMIGEAPLTRCTGYFEDIFMQQPTTFYIVWYLGEIGHLKNVVGRGHTYVWGAIRSYGCTIDHNITNADLDHWTFAFDNAPIGEIYRKYEFDLTATYPNGTYINGTSTGARVAIRHYGNNSAIDYNATLGSDGTIPTQTLTMGFYNQTGGNSIYDYNDYNLRISNVTGYAEYNGNFTLNNQEAFVIALQEESGGYMGFPFLALGLIIGLTVGCSLGLVLLSKR